MSFTRDSVSLFFFLLISGTLHLSFTHIFFFLNKHMMKTFKGVPQRFVTEQN